MPFYDYKCGKCGKKFEVMHGMNSKPSDLKCEHCGAGDVQRVFYPVGRLSSQGGSSPSSSGKSCSSCASGSCGSCH